MFSPKWLKHFLKSLTKIFHNHYSFYFTKSCQLNKNYSINVSMLKKSTITWVEKKHVLDSSTRSDFPCIGKLPIGNNIILLKSDTLLLTLNLIASWNYTSIRCSRCTREVLPQSGFCFHQYFSCGFYFSEHSSSKFSFHLGFISSTQYDIGHWTSGAV